MKHNLNNTEELELKREIITCENVKCGIANKDNTILGDTLTMTSKLPKHLRYYCRAMQLTKTLRTNPNR